MLAKDASSSHTSKHESATCSLGSLSQDSEPFFFFVQFQRTNFVKINSFGYYLLVFVFTSIGENFPEARVRRNSSPQPPPSAAPERISERFAKLRQQFRSKWVCAKFRVRDLSKRHSESSAFSIDRDERPESLGAKRYRDWKYHLR